jgi:AcrR family transcriptional regulator
MERVMTELSESLEGTRDRILSTALDLFGERGFTGVSIRDIASRAKVNVAAISYHFGGKAALYRAVAQHVIDGIESRVRSRAGALIEAPPSDPAAALMALETLVETVVDVIVGPPEMRRVARFVIREQMQPTAAFEILFGTMSRLHRVACRLFGAAAGLEPEAAETRLRVFLVLGQVIFLRIAEAAVLRRMAIEHYDERFLAEVKRLLRHNLRAIVAAVREERS